MNAPVQPMRRLARALVLVPVLLALAPWSASSEQSLDGAPDWAFAVVAGVALVALTAAETLGYRVAAIPPTTPAAEVETRAVGAFTTSMIRRAALTEVPALTGIGLGVAVEDGGYAVVLLGCAISLVAMLWEVPPGDRQIARVTSGLERENARVPLRAILHGDPH